MEHERNHPSTSHNQQLSSASSSSNSHPSDRALRSSSRIKAAKEKEKEEAAAEHSSKRTRDNSGKGKGKEVVTESTSVRTSKRTRKATQPPTPAALIINEPTRDPKGKKRAAPESISEDESAAPSSKKPRGSSSSYSLRSKAQQMPKKASNRTTPKGKTSAKGKAVAAPGPSRRLEDDDDMMDVDFGVGMHDEDDESAHDDDDDDDDEVEEGDAEKRAEGNADRHAGLSGADAAAAAEARRMVEESAFSMFGDISRLGGYMSQISSRLRTLLNNIKPTADPTTRLVALQELSELLSISTEDTLAGSFQVEGFVRELVRILGGTGEATGDDGDGDDDEENNDEDAALAAALQLSAGGAYAGDENLEAQLLACRCLANLMEALPGCGHTLVYHGAIPVLCSKLIEISYIDLAEQTLITLEKISEEYPSAIVREGGLSALLNYLDFFSIAVQRTALQAASNCCRNASSDSFPMIKEVWPIIRNCLGYADQRVVDYASLCVIRVIESYHRSNADKLDILIDSDLIRAVVALLLPAGGSSIVPANTFTLLLRALATAARASPTITVTLLEANIVTILYQILTGVLPSEHDETEQGNGATGQGLGGGLADMTVMQNLAHRPKEQVEEALTLVSELMPPLPKDGVFDHKGYSERALHRMIKAKAKADRAAARANASAALQSALPSRNDTPASSRAHTPTGGRSTPAEEDGTPAPAQDAALISEAAESSSGAAPSKGVSIDRGELLKSKSGVMNRFIGLIVPILVDVYAASVSIPIRIKSLVSLLKAICFQEQDQLKQTLKNVPIASFASSILSSKDHPNLMIGALQMVELLLAKDDADYKASFRREGVLHEIELLAARPLPPKSKEKEKEKEQPKEGERPSADGVPDGAAPAVIPLPGSSSKKSHLLDPEDAYTLRARVIKFKYLTGDVQGEGDATFTSLRHLVETFSQKAAVESELRSALKELAGLFSSPRSTVSSFELLQSGLVDALLEFTTSKEGNVDLRCRQRMFIEELCTVRDGKPVTSTSSFAVLVKKLQESLTRMESFEVITVTPGMEDTTKRNSASLLARQIRLRLVAAEGTDTPRGCNNIIVSIHAIATFQALNDYLRPRLSGLLSNLGGSRFSSMLAALASGRYVPGSLSSRLAESSASTLGGGLPLPPPPDLNGTSAQAESKPSGNKPPERRRSQRLSAKASSTSLAENGGASSTLDTASSAASLPPPSSTSTSTTMAAPRPPKELSREEIELAAREAAEALDSASGDFMDADIDAEVLDEDLDHDEQTERTVSLSVADDGTKVVAQTPEGTRVATPNPLRDQAATAASSSSSARPSSYAAALKNKPTDWHLEFSMDDQSLPLDMTIYGAVHQHEARKTTGPPVPLNLIWQGVYPVKYKKVMGPRPSPEARQDTAESPTRSRSPVPTLTSLPTDAAHSKILRLLRVLHKLNTQIADEDIVTAQSLAETAFINNKLTAKLTRQLEEPMIVASSCLPDWAMDLPLHFPFLFPFTTRFSFLQSTSFGYARLILKWQSQQNRAQESSRRDDTFGFLGRLQRQKVRISREHILQSAFKVFELYGSSSSILEVEYFDEVGTGLGPTLEFYSLVSREFARRDLKIWRDEDSTNPGPYVHHPHGLFPAPIVRNDSTKAGEKRIYVFRTIGQFVAKAMLDSRIIDITFNKIFLKLILGEEVPLTIASLKHVDPPLANSLAKLQAYIPSDGIGSSDTDRKYPDQLMNIEDLMLDFTLPGYDIELRPDGHNIPVTHANVKEYIDEVIDAIIGEGAMQQAKAFREGFSKVFPVTDLLAFSADELVILFGSAEEDWSIETLSEALKADHGFNVESPAIRDLLAIMSDYEAPSRRNFLQFITGSPKLPIGGFRGLNPPLTVVRKPHEAPLTADDYLPSVMTCVNYLKLPQYSTKAVMKEKLDVAMKEGVGSFHLS